MLSKYPPNLMILGFTLATLTAMANLLSGCTDKNKTGISVSATNVSSDVSDRRKSDLPKLIIEDLVKGSGAEAANGKAAIVHYTGWLQDGIEFDSSVAKNKPLKFQLGSGMVIAGWDKGILGMKVGGKRKLTIPPNLAYGEAGHGKIPGGATLTFTVELVDVTD